MKTHILTALLLSTAMVITLSSCKKDKPAQPAAPTIQLTEVGHDNNRQAVQGDDMHLEATVTAPGLIKRIDVEIHQEGGSFKIEQAWTEGKYIGVKNTEFHEHIDIPAEAPLGACHLHFTVSDQKGQTATAEASVQVVANTGEKHHEE
ncbi:MAG: DUF4625 domain-containing protein [Bacteroidales bacterium]|nr:DUF4625 domain-containing protein [Bacteroidales bacterium]